MSRSYKKNLVIKDCNRFAKNQANRFIRRTAGDIPDGKAYRKFYESWNISDFWSRYDPRPRQRYGLVMIEPDPVWRWRMK